MLRQLNEQLRHWLKINHIRGAFPITVANKSIRTGIQSIFQVNFF